MILERYNEPETLGKMLGNFKERIQRLEHRVSSAQAREGVDAGLAWGGMAASPIPGAGSFSRITRLSEKVIQVDFRLRSANSANPLGWRWTVDNLPAPYQATGDTDVWLPGLIINTGSAQFGALYYNNEGVWFAYGSGGIQTSAIGAGWELHFHGSYEHA